MTQKAIFDLPIGPGQYTEQSERGAVGRWYSMDKVRFRKGLAEKIGGWSRLDSTQFLGVCRRLRDWTSLDTKKWVALGTDVKLYVWENNVLYDITPIRRTVTLTAPFTTFTGETRVLVTDTNHGAREGDYVTFSNAIVGGASGITVDGEYRIDNYVNPDSYEITHSQSATTGGAGEGGTEVLAEYQINTGAATAVTATGYGTGPYGREGYGNARTGSTILLSLRTWALDTWGEDLLASPRGGAIYWWDRSKGTGTRAQVLGEPAPSKNEYMIVSQRDRHVIALGAYDYFNDAFDPMLIRWSSTEDLNDWIPTSTNTSGDLRLYSGSKIVTGVRSRLETLVFTDVSVHTLPFFGGFDVFGLNTVGENVSILGPNAAVPIDARVVFMAESDFYIYDGIVKVLNCDVRNWVYDNLNDDQRDKVYGGLNREFNEVWFFYPSFDPLAYTQQAFDLRLPLGYELANSSGGAPICYDYQFNSAGFTEVQADSDTTPTWTNVEFLFAADGPDGARTYTSEDQNAYVLSFTGSGGFPELDTAQSKFGGSSAYFDPALCFICGIHAQDNAATADAMSSDPVGWCIESWIRHEVLPSTHTDIGNTVFSAWQANSEQQFILLTNTSGELEFTYSTTGTDELDLVSSGANLNDIDTWHHVAVSYDAVAQILRMFSDGVVVYEATFTGFRDTGGTGGDNIRLGYTNDFPGRRQFKGWLDDVRIVVGETVYTASFTPPTAAHPIGAGMGGTPCVYQQDYILTNNEPIEDPLNAEYAVELDVNPLITTQTGIAGISFLRIDLVGTGGTQADDAKMWSVELDYDNNLVQIVRWISTGGPAAPDNLMGNTVDFTTLTGAAMTTGQKYIITVAVETPQITVWVDGNQAFQFDMSSAELIEFAGTDQTIALHVRSDFAADNNDAYRFYNLSSGPVGVLTATDFDISPIEVNRYVIFNYEEGTWATGMLARTAWADRSPLLDKAYAASADGYLYEHETGTDDNGAAMAAYIESFDMEIPNAGEELMHVDQLIPDFLTLEGDVTVNLTGRKYPQADRITKGPYTVASNTRKVSTRMRARQVAIKITSSDTGDKWRMGTWRGRAGPHGKRG